MLKLGELKNQFTEVSDNKYINNIFIDSKPIRAVKFSLYQKHLNKQNIKTSKICIKVQTQRMNTKHRKNKYWYAKGQGPR